MNYQVSARRRVDLIVAVSVMRACRKNKEFQHKHGQSPSSLLPLGNHTSALHVWVLDRLFSVSHPPPGAVSVTPTIILKIGVPGPCVGPVFCPAHTQRPLSRQLSFIRLLLPALALLHLFFGAWCYKLGMWWCVITNWKPIHFHSTGSKTNKRQNERLVLFGLRESTQHSY